MARPLRIERAGAWYHLTARGNERQPTFRDRRDYQHFCQLLAQAVERFRWRLHAYVLMRNHFHLMVETRDPNLSASMQWLGVSYTVWFNRRHTRIGHLFQGRFKSIIVDPASWALELSRYVHLNPVRVQALGLSKTDRAQAAMPGTAKPDREVVRRRLKTLRQFHWSSYPAYTGAITAPAWLTCDPVLEMIGKGTMAQRQRHYREHVEAAVRQGLSSTPWEQLRAQIVMGSEKFLRKIQQITSGNKREQPSLRRLADKPDWPKVVATVEQIKGERWEDFAPRHGDWGRDLALYLARRHGQLKLAELAALVGVRDYASVGMAVRRFQQRLERDKKLAEYTQKAMNQMLYVEM